MQGGKRKVNKSLKAWVAFVKKVQREEKLSYKDAIHRAKVRKDKGEKWMKGGDGNMEEEMAGGRRRSMAGGDDQEEMDIDVSVDEPQMDMYDEQMDDDEPQMGGRRRRTMRRRRGSRRRTMRRRRGSRRR